MLTAKFESLKTAIGTFLEQRKLESGLPPSKIRVLVTLDDGGETSVFMPAIITADLLEDGKSIEFSTKDGRSIGKFNGLRMYWSWDTSDIEFDPESKSNSGTICKDKTRYTTYDRGERKSMDCADDVAIFMRQFSDVDSAVSVVVRLLDSSSVPVPKNSSASSWSDHVIEAWSKLNPGQRRMVAGQALRSAVKNYNVDTTALKSKSKSKSKSKK